LRIDFADNTKQNVLNVLAAEVPKASELKFAVAFVSQSGLKLIEPYLDKCLRTGGHAEFLIGLNVTATEPQAVQYLCQLKQQGLPVTCYCFSDPTRRREPIYHPKLYLMCRGEQVTAVIGSSNLTEGGLRRNIEINAVIRGDLYDETVSDIYEIYNNLKFGQPHVEPDAETLALYRELCERAHDAAQGSAPKATDELVKRLRSKVKTLNRPKPTVADLYGWQKLIFDRLPAGVFKTNDIYAFERDFQQFYPSNQNIRPKIRQTLQKLEKLGLLRHIGEARWERV
jgi:HKD family nuclease